MLAWFLLLCFFLFNLMLICFMHAAVLLGAFRHYDAICRIFHFMFNIFILSATLVVMLVMG